MWILIDPPAIARFERAETRRIGGWRTYYVTVSTDDRLALIVCRDGLLLEGLAGQVVDAAIGWDDGREWFVYSKNETHTKVTIYFVPYGAIGRAQRSLTHVLDDAPVRA